MLRKLSNYFGSLPDAHIDCVLYALIAWFIFSQAYLGGDEASKFLAPWAKFWINYGIGSAGAFFGAVKMFRSTSYAEHQQKKNSPTPAYVPEPGKDGPVP